MEQKLRIVLINHTFQKDYFCKRWKMFAMDHPNIDVILLSPGEWQWGNEKTLTFGSVETITSQRIDEENYHNHPIDMKKHKYISWTSKQLVKEIREKQPDIVYHIGLHDQESLLETIHVTKRHARKAKIIAFSMRGPYHDIKIKKAKCSLIKWFARRFLYLYQKAKLAYVYRYCDAILCHYPDAVESFRKEGYKKPIYMQTQVGVDTDVFKQDIEARKRIRMKYELGDAFVFGSATRFTPDKGLSDVIDALPKEGNWKFLMMGSGLPEENDEIRKQIKERGLEEKIILSGFVDWHDMADHWNAIDCAVHVPRTTENWIETFSLSVVQAMATGLPVIGNTSGSVPYQLGPEGIVVAEGNRGQLNQQFTYMIKHQEEGKIVGAKMYERATKCFNITHLNECFYNTILDVCNGIYDKRKVDMTEYLVE